MSATIDLTTVTNTIEALTITGVTILDVDEIVEDMSMMPATLAPRPEDFITNTLITRDDSSGRLLKLEYTLNYRYYHCPIAGGLGGIFGSYSAMLTKILAIQLKLMDDAALTGAVDYKDVAPYNIGPVQDPAGNWHLGCEFGINFTQFVEV